MAKTAVAPAETAPAVASTSYEDAAIPAITRGTGNPHIDKVRELNASRLAGENGGKGRAAALTVPAAAGPDGELDAAGVHARDVGRVTRQLQDAGTALGITVRKHTARQDDGSTRIVFWTTDKQSRPRTSESSDAAAPAASAV
jgi:hypothetical protein